MKTKRHNIMQPTKRTFQNPAGGWMEKRTLTEIIICECGNKYIKTRKNQTTCIRCVYRAAPIKNK